MKIIKFLIAILLLNISNSFAYNYYYHYNRPFYPHYHQYLFEDAIIEYPAYNTIDRLKQKIHDLRLEKRLHPELSPDINAEIHEYQDRIDFLENHY